VSFAPSADFAKHWISDTTIFSSKPHYQHWQWLIQKRQNITTLRLLLMIAFCGYGNAFIVTKLYQLNKIKVTKVLIKALRSHREFSFRRDKPAKIASAHHTFCCCHLLHLPVHLIQRLSSLDLVSYFWDLLGHPFKHLALGLYHCLDLP